MKRLSQWPLFQRYDFCILTKLQKTVRWLALKTIKKWFQGEIHSGCYKKVTPDLIFGSLYSHHFVLVKPQIVKLVRGVMAVDLERVDDHRQGKIFIRVQAAWVVPYVVWRLKGVKTKLPWTSLLKISLFEFIKFSSEMNWSVVYVKIRRYLYIMLDLTLKYLYYHCTYKEPKFTRTNTLNSQFFEVAR